MLPSQDKKHAGQVTRHSPRTPAVDERPALQFCPFCNAEIAALDDNIGDELQSQTLKCERCGECHLHVRQGVRTAVIHLRQFLERRGGAPEQRPLHERTMAQNLVTAMLSDEWPTAATCMDFGLDSDDRYKAMQRAVKAGLTAYELDRVLGDGDAITELVAFALNSKRLHTIEFTTPYDDLPADPTDDEERRLQHKLATKSQLDF